MQVAAALNALVDQAPSRPPVFEYRKDGTPAVGVVGVAAPLLTATAEDAAAYDRPWEGAKARQRQQPQARGPALGGPPPGLLHALRPPPASAQGARALAAGQGPDGRLCRGPADGRRGERRAHPERDPAQLVPREGPSRARAPAPRRRPDPGRRRPRGPVGRHHGRGLRHPGHQGAPSLRGHAAHRLPVHEGGSGRDEHPPEGRVPRQGEPALHGRHLRCAPMSSGERWRRGRSAARSRRPRTSPRQEASRSSSWNEERAPAAAGRASAPASTSSCRRPSVLRGLRLGLVANPASVTRGLEHAAIALSREPSLRLRVALRSRARRVGRRPGPGGGRRQPRPPDRPARLEPLRSYPGPHRRDAGRSRRGRLRHAGRGRALLHLCLHDAPRARGLRPRRPPRRRPRPAQPPGRASRSKATSSTRHSPRSWAFTRCRYATGSPWASSALLFREERGLDVDLTVIRMKGWRRAMDFEDTGLPWVMPSPNMPTVDTAFVYPGGCLVEGHEPLRGPGDDATVRARGRSLDRSVGAGQGPRATSDLPAPRSAPSSSRPRFKSTRARPAAGCRSTSRIGGAFPPTSPTCS